MDSRDLNIVLLGLVVLLIAFSSSQPAYVGYATKQCIDGDGYNPFFKGKATVSAGHAAWDSCIEDKDLVQEFTCMNGELHFTFVPCTGGCLDGRCLPPAESPPSTVKETFFFGTNVDQVEINEHLGDVQSTLDERDLRALRGGTLSSRSGITEFSQYLRFNDDITTGRIAFGKNERGAVGDYLYFDRDDFVFEYLLQFSNGFVSSVSGTSLPDLKGKNLVILGRTYIVAEAEKNGNTVSLDLVGGDYSDWLAEGSSKTYRYKGRDHTVEAAVIADLQQQVTLRIDGILHQSLSEGDVARADDLLVGVGNILIQESGEGKDLAELWIGARTLSFADDASDDLFRSGITVNGKSISEGQVKIKGTNAGGNYRISSIAYRLKPDAAGGGDVYVEKRKGIREFIDEPDALLGPWDLHYGGLKHDGSTTIAFDPAGNNQYNLKFVNVQGKEHVVGIVFNNGGTLEISDGTDDVNFIEGSSSSDYIIALKEYLVLSDDDDKTGVTHIVRYDSIDTASKTIHFDDLSEGGKPVTYTGTEGTNAQGNLVLSGTTYRVFVGGGPGYGLAVDLDGDGDADGSEVKIVTRGGGIIDLGSSMTPGASFEMTLTTEGSQFDEGAPNEIITIGVVKNGNDVDLALEAQNSLSIKTRDSKTLALSPYGVHLEKDNGNPDRMAITYPLSQSFGEVKLVFSADEVEVAAVDVDDCGNKVCGYDEGYMNCPADCPFVDLKEEQPTIIDLCGNGACDEGENPSSCPGDCITYEEPALRVPERRGFWSRLWAWITGLFA